MIKTLTAALALTVLASFATAAPMRMSDAQLDTVVAGTVDCKGNNGWGNGFDPTNAGSFSGGTEPSKSINGSAISDNSALNINPTTSTGR